MIKDYIVNTLSSSEPQLKGAQHMKVLLSIALCIIFLIPAHVFSADSNTTRAKISVLQSQVQRLQKLGAIAQEQSTQLIDQELSGLRQSIKGWRQKADNYDSKISTLDELLKKADENQKPGIQNALESVLKRKANA